MRIETYTGVNPERISQVIKMQTTRGNVHESCYQSFSLLEYVIEMLERGDSHETILGIINYIKNYEETR